MADQYFVYLKWRMCILCIENGELYKYLLSLLVPDLSSSPGCRHQFSVSLSLNLFMGLMYLGVRIISSYCCIDPFTTISLLLWNLFYQMWELQLLLFNLFNLFIYFMMVLEVDLMSLLWLIVLRTYTCMSLHNRIVSELMSSWSFSF